jgi:hypothetical protein
VSISFLLIIFRVTLPCVVHSLIRAPPNGGSLKQKVLCSMHCNFEKVEYVAFVKRTRRKKNKCVFVVFYLMSSLQGESFFFLIMPRKKYRCILIKHHVNTVTRYPVLEE